MYVYNGHKMFVAVVLNYLFSIIASEIILPRCSNVIHILYSGFFTTGWFLVYFVGY